MCPLKCAVQHGNCNQEKKNVLLVLKQCLCLAFLARDSAAQRVCDNVTL